MRRYAQANSSKINAYAIGWRTKAYVNMTSTNTVRYLRQNSHLPTNSTQWLDSLRQNELGALLRGSLITVKRKLRVRKDFRNSKRIAAQLNTRLAAGSFHKTEKRLRLVRRADGYYAQFAIDVKVRVQSNLTGKMVGLDLGLKFFIADNLGNTEPCPQFYRKSEKQLNRANRKKSKKFKRGAFPQSKNYYKARNRYARKHLGVSGALPRTLRDWQRKEYCKRVAYSVIQSNDLVAYEDLNVKGLVKNRHLAKSISDAGWSTFRQWLEYFGFKYGKLTIAVPPHNTSQNCSHCAKKVKKSLSTRTHVCPHCGFIEDRDINAAINILKLALCTVGHTGTYAWGDLPSWGIGAILSSNCESVNQESPCL